MITLYFKSAKRSYIIYISEDRRFITLTFKYLINIINLYVKNPAIADDETPLNDI